MSGLQDKVAIVTGGGSGIGQGTAERLAAVGATVVVADLDLAAAQGVAAELPGALAVQADVADEDAVDRLFDATVSTFGRVDLVHNNAGITEADTTVQDLSLADYERTQAVDARGVFLVLRAALRRMVEQGGGGSIVNTAALVGLVGNSTQPAYTAAKHAVIGLTRVAAANGGPHGIRVNAVCPGMIATPALQTLLDEETKARLTAAIPLGRPGTMAELAASVAWLLSDDAAYITGTHLVVDGGFLACAM